MVEITTSKYNMAVTIPVSCIKECSQQFKHLLKGDNMKLELNRFYKTRDGRKAEVVYINDTLSEFHQVSYLVAGVNTLSNCRYSDGRRAADYLCSTDLIEEWQDPVPQINITVDDVGKKVRHRNGAVSLIVSVHANDSNSLYLVFIGAGQVYKRNGNYRSDGVPDAKDIVEVLG